MNSSANAWAVIVAAGRGKRFGGGEPKQFAHLAGRPMVVRALDPFRSHRSVLGVTLVVPPEHAERPPTWLSRLSDGGVRVVPGGETRTDSVSLGLETVADSAQLVAIHDGARPLITSEAISLVLAAAGAERGAIAARPVTDSLKRADANGLILSSVDRDGLWRAETPQVFPRQLIIDIHSRARADRITESDCAALCQRYGVEIQLVEIPGPNTKVTHLADMALAEAWISQREPRTPTDLSGT